MIIQTFIIAFIIELYSERENIKLINTENDQCDRKSFGMEKQSTAQFYMYLKKTAI